MKKLPLILILFFSFSLFFVNVPKANALCRDWDYEIGCEGECATGGKSFTGCDWWSPCDGCGT